MSNFAIRISSMEVRVQFVLLSSTLLEPVMQRAHVNVMLGVKRLDLKASGLRQKKKNGRASFHLIGEGKRGVWDNADGINVEGPQPAIVKRVGTRKPAYPRACTP